MFDVLKVDSATRKVRIIAQGKGARAADSICALEILRQGCNDGFFVVSPSGRYAEGESWKGSS